MDNMPSLADIAAVTDGKTDGFNGGFWIFALILIFAMMGGGFGGWNRQGEFGQYATAASQQEILFGQHFGQINDRLTNIGNGICDSTFALNNAITTEGRNLSNQLANCCCEQRLGIANLSAQMNQNTCDITTAIHAEAEAEVSGSRSLCRLKANLRHDLCNIVERSPPYGTLIQIPPFFLNLTCYYQNRTSVWR